MKRKPLEAPKRECFQLRPNDRDRKLMRALQENNRTLKQAQIFRLALDALAEKQGLLARVS